MIEKHIADEEVRERLGPIADFKLSKICFPKQKDFIKDPSKLKTLFCTRRAAKSFTAGVYLVYEALRNPGCNCLFIGLTRDSAKSIIWKDILHIICQRYNIPATFNLTELTVTLFNGSVIKVTGIDTDESDMNKLLGRKYRLVCIDEASMYTIDLERLVYGILKPAMIDPNSDGQRGTICLMGTSSNYIRGLFYNITTLKERGWALHSWTALDNPFVAKQFQEELEEIKTLRPAFMETPLFKQWYLNQWVIDTDKLVYKYDLDKNQGERPDNLQPAGWTYVLGVDTGWEDDNAFVLGGYHEYDKTFYIIKTFNKPKMTFDDVVGKINEFLEDKDQSPCKVIIDGANKQGVESMRARSAIPFEYADKLDKVTFIEMLNSDLIQSRIKISKLCPELANEMMGLVWKTDADRIIIPKKEHPSLPNHLCDAMLYAWRCGFHYHATTPTKVIPKYSREWYNAQAVDIWEREKEQIMNPENESINWD